MSEDRSDKDTHDFLANNNGVVKTKKGLVLTIIGIVGFFVYLGVVSVLAAIPDLQLAVGIYLMVAG